MDLWSIGGGGQGQSVMKLIQCSGLPEILVQLVGGPSAKVGTSAKYEHTSKFTLASRRSFLRKTNKIEINIRIIRE